ncbi:anchored repeat ABC transporter, substrate-binding protein [Bacillus sp. S34]|nr:anchored repeat ABC transporter, substrate-binding protein [Bacillus sp. S34]
MTTGRRARPRRRTLRREHTAEDGTDEVEHDDPAAAVVSVPNTALKPIPSGPGFRFLGDPGSQVYQLPQAILGVHVHGSIDPHLWQDVRNAQAYVKVIRDALAAKDPQHADEYRRNAADYLDVLTKLDNAVRKTIASIPENRRHLVTTHDAFAYLAKAYGMKVSGFVTPNPAAEPSLADRQRLGQTIRELEIPAVFLEPNLAARSSTLTSVAEEQGVEVCRIYGDTFGPDVHSYTEMMRFNAQSLRTCLTD